MNSRRILPVAVLAVTFPTLLGAGSLILTKQQARRNSKDRLYLQKGDLRIETEGGQVMIYRSADDAFWLLDTTRKTYVDGAPKVLEGEHKAGARIDPVPATYQKVASGVDVNGFKADQYDVNQGTEKIAEVWLAAPQAAGIDPADAAGLRLLTKRLGYRAPSYFGFALSESLPEGVPVRTVTYSHGQRISINDFETVQRQDFPASLFELPPDYKPGAIKP